MRRRILLLLVPIVAACSEPAVPRVAVVVNVEPLEGANIAAAHVQQAGEAALDLILEPQTAPMSAEAVLQLAHGLAQDPGIIAVVGHSSSAMSLTAAHVYNDAGLVQIAPTSTAPAYSEAGPHSFRMVPSDVQQAHFIADIVRSRWASARVAVVYVNDEYGRGLHGELKPKLEHVAFEAIHSESPDTTQLHELGERLAAVQPELIIWLGRPHTLQILWRRWRDAMPGAAVLCSDACDASLAYANPNSRLTGVHFVRFIDADADVPDLRAFQQQYRHRTGQPAAVEAILTYDAVRLIGQALASGVRTRDELQRYLVSLGKTRAPYVGLSGPIRFTDQGDVVRPYLLALVTDTAVIAVPVTPVAR